MNEIPGKELDSVELELLLSLLNASGAQPQEQEPGKALMPLARGQHFPTSHAQRRTWFFDQLAPMAGAVNNLTTALRLRGVLDCDALQRALDRIVARHESLRTSFAVEGGEPVQRIELAQIGCVLRHVDLGQLQGHERERAITRVIEEEAAERFVLSTAPLIRGRLLRLGEQEHLMLLTQHHIASDAWSTGVLVHEVKTLYNAFSQGQEDPLPPLAIQYADYAAWQREWLQGEALEGQLGYWREHLQGAPALLELPTDRTRPAVQSYAGGSVQFMLPEALTSKLKALGQAHGTTLFMTLMAGWAALLARLSGQDDVVVGVPVANRQRAELEPLIGFFVNTLAMRVKLEEGLTVAGLLAQVKASALGAYAHQDVPFEQVVEVLKPVRSMAHSPVFQAMLALDNTPPGTAVELPGLELSVLAVPITRTHFDLALSCTLVGGQLQGSLEYASDLFDRTTAERMAKLLQRLLEAMVEPAASEREVARLVLLTPAQREQVLEGFNETVRPYPRQARLNERFEQWVREQPQQVALVEEGCELSYGELDRRARGVAGRLQAMGVGRGDRVALCAPRGAALTAALLGVMKLGAVCVPLDPDSPVQRLQQIVQDAGAGVVLVDTAERGVSWHSVLVLDELAPAESDAIAASEVTEATADDLAYVIHTSGSTGRAKGVMLDHRSIVRLVSDTSYAQAGPGKRVAHCANTGFDAAAWEIWFALANGATLVVVAQAVLLDAERLQSWLLRQSVNVLFLTVGLFNQHAHALQSVFKGLDYLMFGGEQADPGVVAKVLRESAPANLVHCYGPTETTTFATTHRLTSADVGDRGVPIGRPVANTRVYVLDRHGSPVPPGVVGELHIGGEGVAQGYLGQPELTSERFIADEYGLRPGAKRYRTGDLARWRADGVLEFLGRNDAQVKIRGFRIEPGEIEARLGACVGVREAAVVVHASAQGDKRLVAYVVGDVEAAALRQELAQQLPDYMVPAMFVRLQALPLTPNGKLDRRALPAPDVGAMSAPYEAPRGEFERAIAEVWQELLGLPRVGRNDHFFELGGHSLLAMQLVSALRRRLGVEVALARLFAHPTLTAFASVVADSRAQTMVPLVPADRTQPLALSWAQQRLWFLDQLEASAGAAYHMPTALRLKGALDQAALKRALDRVVARHESLRTSFAMDGDQPVQRIAPADCGFQLQEVDLSELHGHEQESALERRVTDEAAAPFDLSTGPMIRGQLVKLGQDDHALLLTQHHIVSDGWSIGVLVGEVTTLYAAFSQGQDDPLPPLVIQYADYAAWQREWLQGEALEGQLGYWREHLQGAPALLELPTDRTRPAVQSYAGGSVSFMLPESLTSKLKALGQAHGTTLFMTLMAGWAALLARLSGQDDVVVGVPVANRQRAELEPLIGFFVNTLAMRVKLEEGLTVAGLLAQVKASALGAYAHQDVPFEQVVEALKPVRSMAHSPVFQAMLALDNTPPGRAKALPGLVVEPMGAPSTTAQFDVLLSLQEMGEVIGGALTPPAQALIGLCAGDETTLTVGGNAAHQLRVVKIVRL